MNNNRSARFNGQYMRYSNNAPNIKIEMTKIVGSLYLLKPFIEALGVREAVDCLVPMERDVGGLTHGQVIEQLLLNRLDSPCPMMDIEKWALAKGVQELYDIPCEKLNDDRIGRALDALSDYIPDIEGLISTAALTRFKIEPDAILWDTTSFYFEGDYDQSQAIDYGYSRDQKPDKKQVVVELNITSKEGVVLGHRTLPGNASDKKEVINNLETLQNSIKNKDLIVIGDRAMFSKPNLAKLTNKPLKFLGPLSSKERNFILSLPENSFVPLNYVTAKGKGGYSGVDTNFEFIDNKITYMVRAIVIKSEELYLQQQKTLARQLELVGNRLTEIQSHLNNRRFKKRDYVSEQIDKAFTSKSKLRSFFNITLEGTDENLTMQWAVDNQALKEEHRLLGKYILVTNLKKSGEETGKTFTPDQILDLYKSRHKIENQFRSLKSTLKIRPIFLESEKRIKSLVLVNILALMVYSLIEWFCKQEKLTTSAKKAMDMFRLIEIISFTFNGQLFHQIGNVIPAVDRILNALKIEPPEFLGITY